MKSGDVVVFRANGNLELKSGILIQGLLGSPYITGNDKCIYGLGVLDMIQVYPDSQKADSGYPTRKICFSTCLKSNSAI